METAPETHESVPFHQVNILTVASDWCALHSSSAASVSMTCLDDSNALKNHKSLFWHKLCVYLYCQIRAAATALQPQRNPCLDLF